MAENLEDKILKWINKEGYPLEMKASQILRKIGFEVGQSIYYLDNESQDSREIDIVAYKYYKVSNDWVTFSFVIECKSSNDKPWVTFSAKEERLYANDFVIYRDANHWGQEILRGLAVEEKIRNLSLFKLNERTAYSTVRAFSEGADMTFKAIKSVTKATLALVDKGNKTNSYRFFFPIILIDGRLFDCHLDSHDEQVLTELDGVKLVQSTSNDNKRVSILDIMTLNGFEERMSHYMREIDFIVEEYEKLITEHPLF